MNFMLHFVVEMFKFVCPTNGILFHAPGDVKINIDGQPQKRTCKMCCLRVRINLVTYVGIIYNSKTKYFSARVSSTIVHHSSTIK